MKVIAEIGTSHGGNLEKAFALIDQAAQSGADIIKFQWVYADEILHPDTGFVLLPGGKTRLYDRFKALEVDKDFFKSCLDYTHKKGLLFSCSPFGLRSLNELVEIGPDAIKIASPEANHIPLLKECAKYYKKIPIILSSGVCKLSDIEKALEILRSGDDKDFSKGLEYDIPLPPLTLLHCITFYPAPEDEYNVRCLETLRNIFGIPTGISDHSTDPILVPLLAVAMGGTLLEKHITLSKKTDGLDDPVALEGEEFTYMCHCVKQAGVILEKWKKESEDLGGKDGRKYTCTPYGKGLNLNPAQFEIIRQLENQYTKEKILTVLGSGIKKLSKSESQNYGRTNRSLHYTRNIKKGERLLESDFAVLRTEKVLSPGLAPDFIEDIKGAVLQQDVISGQGLKWSDFLS